MVDLIISGWPNWVIHTLIFAKMLKQCRRWDDLQWGIATLNVQNSQFLIYTSCLLEWVNCKAFYTKLLLGYTVKYWLIDWFHQETQMLVAFLMGGVSHAVADITWHSLGISQGFISTMAKVGFCYCHCF